MSLFSRIYLQNQILRRIR